MSGTFGNVSGDLCDVIKASIEDGIPGAQASVTGGGGHYSIRVVSQVFEGKSMLNKQRAVLKHITHLMDGAGAPLHAVDSLETLLP